MVIKKVDKVYNWVKVDKANLPQGGRNIQSPPPHGG